MDHLDTWNVSDRDGHVATDMARLHNVHDTTGYNGYNQHDTTASFLRRHGATDIIRTQPA